MQEIVKLQIMRLNFVIVVDIVLMLNLDHMLVIPIMLHHLLIFLVLLVELVTVVNLVQD
jgi:hypothetical protein